MAQIRSLLNFRSAIVSFVLPGLILAVSGRPTRAWAAPVPAKTDVVIVGAGLSGLAAAYELKKAGFKAQVLEIGNRVGGRVRTVKYQRPGQKDVYADSGMEEYWESNPAVEYLKELKLPVRSDVALSSIVLQKKLYPLGDESAAEFQKKLFSAAEIQALEGFKKKVTPIIEEIRKATVERPVSPALLKLKDISFADWLEKEKLPKKVIDWVRVSVECEIGTSIGRISALDGLAEFHIFLGEGEKSYRVQGGNDQFTQALAQAVGTEKIALGKRVTRISQSAGAVRVNFLDLESNLNGVIEAKRVIVTIPLFRLFEVQFDPPLSEKKRQAIQTMSWGSYFKAHFFLKPGAEKLWIKPEGSILPLLSDSELGVIYDGNPDQKGQNRIISILVHGDPAERFNMQPLDQVRSELLASFEKLWPGFKEQVLDVEFYRFHPRAIASWPVGRSRYDELSNEIRRPDGGLYLAGDFTESSHSDGAFISARRVVQSIVKELKPRSP